MRAAAIVMIVFATASTPGCVARQMSDDVADADGPRIGAAMLADGLCPWPFSSPPALTLQYSGAPFVCNVAMGPTIDAAGELPNWYAEVFLPFAEPGAYDLGRVEVFAEFNMMTADGGGGGSGSQLDAGLIEIEHVDESVVRGTIHGVSPLGLNDTLFDINGAFEAVRCTPDEWLDFDGFDPDDYGDSFDPACRLPD